MNIYIFNKQSSEIVLDVPEPVEVDFRFIHQRMDFENNWIDWNSRPRYPVSKELSDSWEDGKKVVENIDFIIKIGDQKMTAPDQQQWQEMSMDEKDHYFIMIAVSASDPIEDEFRMIISHALLGEDHNISKSGFNLIVKECAKYYKTQIK